MIEMPLEMFDIPEFDVKTQWWGLGVAIAIIILEVLIFLTTN